MRLLWTLVLPLTLLAQEPAEKKEAKTETESPAPSTEKTLDGYVDLGARWVGWAGDFNTYRSLVNLSQGLRLVGMDIGWEPAGNKLFDSVRVQAFNWGGDPYNTARLDMLKRGKYRFLGTYSNIAYYNYLPSFADPTIPQGIYMNQRSYDTSVRNFDNELQLFPGGRVIPYLAYSRNSDYGWGITTFVATGNEYPLRNVVNWNMNEVRGGLRFEFNRWHATIEQGTNNFHDNQYVYSTESSSGNRTTPYLGQPLYLTNGQQFYAMHGSGDHTKAYLTASPFNWLDLSGQFMRTSPKTYSNFSENETGNFVSPLNTAMFYTRGTDMLYGNATMPHISYSGSAEFRPTTRLRIREIYETDKFHTDGTATLTALYLYQTGLPVGSTDTDGERLDVNRNREQIEALYDFSKKISVRGGYRYEWGYSVMKSSPLIDPEPTELAQLERHGALAGFNVRPFSRLSINGDIEIVNGVKTYYRTGLMDTQRYRFQGRLTLPKDLFLNIIYARFTNDNPDPGINYEFKSQTATASLQWLPHGGKNLRIIADYTRNMLRSDIDYLNPLGYYPVQSLYTDYGHTGVLLADTRLPIGKSYAGRLSFGGSFIHTSGSRPTNYYQPQGRIQLPVTPKFEIFSEWRYYGLHQAFYGYEGFRAHTFTGGVRLNL